MTASISAFRLAASGLWRRAVALHFSSEGGGGGRGEPGPQGKQVDDGCGGGGEDPARGKARGGSRLASFYCYSVMRRGRVVSGQFFTKQRMCLGPLC